MITYSSLRDAQAQAQEDALSNKVERFVYIRTIGKVYRFVVSRRFRPNCELVLVAFPLQTSLFADDYKQYRQDVWLSEQLTGKS